MSHCFWLCVFVCYFQFDAECLVHSKMLMMGFISYLSVQLVQTLFAQLYCSCSQLSAK